MLGHQFLSLIVPMKQLNYKNRVSYLKEVPVTKTAKLRKLSKAEVNEGKSEDMKWT